MPARDRSSLVSGHLRGVIVLEDHLFFLCTQLIGHRDRILDRELRPLGLSASKWRILAALAAQDRLAMRELAELTTIERTTLTRAIDQLEGAGLVLRAADALDRRIVRLALTREGLAMFERANAVVETVNEAITTGVAEPEALALRTTLKHMRANVLGLANGRAADPRPGRALPEPSGNDRRSA